jgi:hypothetical protein
VQKWLDESYPEIKQRAKEEDAEIHWGDETAVVNTDVRGYAPKGDTPVTYVVGGRYPNKWTCSGMTTYPATTKLSFFRIRSSASSKSFFASGEAKYGRWW